MLESVYIDNFRCLTKLDLQLDRISLFVGTNGTGKSTVFDALERLRKFIVDGAPCKDLFPYTHVTRWEVGTSRLARPQTFKLRIRSGADCFEYVLRVAHESDSPARGDTPYVRSECLACNGEDVYRTPPALPLPGQEHAEPSVDRSRSALAGQGNREDDERIQRFRERMSRLIVVRMNPFAMSAVVGGGVGEPSADLTDFAGWYHDHHATGQAEKTQVQTKLHAALSKALSEMFEGYSDTYFSPDAEGRWVLQLAFNPPAADTRVPAYRLDELSDGQRALLALYAIMYFAEATAAREDDVTLCIDEPDNFIALPEIEPWLSELEDICTDGPVQALLISHHPELLNRLASSSGIWFSRDRNGPVRIEPVEDSDGTGLAVSELYARGWLND